MNITFRTNKLIDKKQLFNLYDNAGWYTYTQDVDFLAQAVSQSYYVLTAWHEDTLVGLLRVISDGLSIAYIQDILVHDAYQKQGIGTKLLTLAKQEFSHIRKCVVLTEDTASIRTFYDEVGFDACDQGEFIAFINRDCSTSHS